MNRRDFLKFVGVVAGAAAASRLAPWAEAGEEVVQTDPAIQEWVGQPDYEYEYLEHMECRNGVVRVAKRVLVCIRKIPASR